MFMISAVETEKSDWLEITKNFHFQKYTIVLQYIIMGNLRILFFAVRCWTRKWI